MKHLNVNLTDKGIGKRTDPFQAAYINYVATLVEVADLNNPSTIIMGLDQEKQDQVTNMVIETREESYRQGFKDGIRHIFNALIY